MSLPLNDIERHLAYVVSTLMVPENLREAIAYSLLGGGKRVRPVLCWHACQAAGCDGARALPACAALELVHVFSLVHDDLPAMDDDDLRRGKPTLHKHAGEAMAILAGDGMLTFAIEHLALSINQPQIVQRLIIELTSGTGAMIAGQVFDTLGGFPNGLSESEKLELIHRNKTGALLAAACRMGVICAQGPDRTLELVTAYAHAVGLMFQIVDDILDVTQSSEKVGKRTGKDAAKGKLTYPGLIGLDASRTEVTRQLELAVEACTKIGEPANQLALVAKFVADREH